MSWFIRTLIPQAPDVVVIGGEEAAPQQCKICLEEVPGNAVHVMAPACTASAGPASHSMLLRSSVARPSP